MNLEERVRNELRGVDAPAGLVPPADLAETVLHRLRRRRQFRAMLAAAVAVLVVGASPLVVLRGGPGGSGGMDRPPGVGGPDPSAGRDVVFPTPGGGRQAIQMYRTQTGTYLLDPAAGRYHAVPLPVVVLSPDGTRAAVSDDEGRTGVAERAALLERGARAVRWLSLPPGNGLFWSPDGTALLLTGIDKSSGRVRFTAYRYDLATGQTTRTPLDLDLIGSSVGWAADSRRYLALVAEERSADSVTPGALRYVNPDGTYGDQITVRGGLVGGAEAYSPSRRLLATDASDGMTEAPMVSPVVDVTTGRVAASVPARSRPVGWYDEETLVVLTPGAAEQRLELLTVATGAVTRSIDLGGLPGPVMIQIGPLAAGRSGPSARFGF